MSDSVRADVDGEVLVVTIDRPAARNVIDGETATALVAAFREFDHDDGLHVAVLTGASGTFCAGADLKAVGSGRGNRVDAHPAGDGPLGPTRLLLGKPVIAAVEGFAVAGGLELALWCDLRVAARDATFGVFCRRWGVPLVDGGTVRLPRLIGHSHALDMILTGRGVSGDEALRMGLANRLVEPGTALDEAIALARQLARLPQRCLRNDRMSSYEQWDLEYVDAMANETRLGLEVIASGETRAGARRASPAGRGGTAPMPDTLVRDGDPAAMPDDIPAVVKPLLRGWSHLVSFLLVVVLGLLLLALTSASRGGQVLLVVYLLGLLAMFGVSACYHRGRWSPSALARWRKLDHSTIFLAIAGAYTPVTVAGLDGWRQTAVLIVVWVGAALGIALQWVPVHVPRAAFTAVYVIVGWSISIALPELFTGLGPLGFALVLGGGCAYTAGAVVYALKRPDPWPTVFGYHEVFHVCTVVGAGMHLVAISFVVSPKL